MAYLSANTPTVMRALVMLVALLYVPAVVVWIIIHYVNPVQG